MSNKNLSLILGIASTLVFILLLTESGPITIPYGLKIDVRIARMAWLFFAIINFASYLGLRKWK